MVSGQRKRPCGFPQGLERSAAANLLFRNERPCDRLLRPPDLEADARPHMEGIIACGSVLAGKLVGHPNLHIDRAKVIPDQAASREGPIAAAECTGAHANNFRPQPGSQLENAKYPGPIGRTASSAVNRSSSAFSLIIVRLPPEVQAHIIRPPDEKVSERWPLRAYPPIQ
jgi:hypothetical protein